MLLCRFVFAMAISQALQRARETDIKIDGTYRFLCAHRIYSISHQIETQREKNHRFSCLLIWYFFSKNVENHRFSPLFQKPERSEIGALVNFLFKNKILESFSFFSLVPLISDMMQCRVLFLGKPEKFSEAIIERWNLGIKMFRLFSGTV